jgi:hypothetical protein
MCAEVRFASPAPRRLAVAAIEDECRLSRSGLWLTLYPARKRIAFLFSTNIEKLVRKDEAGSPSAIAHTCDTERLARNCAYSK